MANGHGGPRTPEHPAPVSGPGRFARRTDGGPTQVMSTVPDLPYGDKKQQMAEQRIAPMGAAEPMPSPAQVPQGQQPQGAASLPAYQGGAFNAPGSGPITAGMPFGPGPGPEALNVPITPAGAQPTGTMTQLLMRLSAGDQSGVLNQLLTMAREHNV